MVLVGLTCLPTILATGSVSWEYDYETGMDRAGSEGKYVLIDFYTDWCGYCDDMDDTTYTDPDVVSKSANFVLIKVDGDDREDIVDDYNVNGYPTTVFLDSSGNEVHRVVGYSPPDEFLGHMEYALEERGEPPDGSATCCVSTVLVLGLLAICLLVLVKRFR